MPQFSLAGLTEQSTEIKALKRELEKGTKQTITSVELDKKLKKIDDAVTRGVSLFFEQGQNLYIVFRKNGDQIQVKQNGKKIPFSGLLNYYADRDLFKLSVKELADNIRQYQPKFDTLQRKSSEKLVNGVVAKTERQRHLAVTTQIKQLSELSLNLDMDIEKYTQDNALLKQEIGQLLQQDVGNDGTEMPTILSLAQDTDPKDVKDDYLKQFDEIRKQQKLVYCPPLQADVEMRKKTGTHTANRGDFKTKLPLLLQLPKLIKTAFDKKEVSVDGKPNITKAWRVFSHAMIDDMPRIVGMNIFEQNSKDGVKYVYDLYVNNDLKIGKGLTLPSGKTSNDEYSPALSQALDDDNNTLDSLSQGVVFDDESQAMLDDAKTGYILNLFIFDKDGNEIDDLTQEPQAEPVQENMQTDNEVYVTDIDTDLSVYGDDNKTAVLAFLKQMQGKYIKTQIGKVLFNRVSTDELQQGVKSNDIRAKIVPFVPNTLQNGEYQGRTELYKERKDGFVAFHEFVGVAEIDNQLIKHSVKVGERENGEYVFIAYHSRGVFDSLNENSPTLSSVSSNKASRPRVGHTENLPINDMNVKHFDSIVDGEDGWNIEILSIEPSIQDISSEQTIGEQFDLPSKDLFQLLEEHGWKYQINQLSHKKCLHKNGRFALETHVEFLGGGLGKHAFTSKPYISVGVRDFAMGGEYQDFGSYCYKPIDYKEVQSIFMEIEKWVDEKMQKDEQVLQFDLPSQALSNLSNGYNDGKKESQEMTSQLLTGYEDYQKMNQLGGATNTDLRTNNPIRSRADVGAFDIDNNLSNTNNDVNHSILKGRKSTVKTARELNQDKPYAIKHTGEFWRADFENFAIADKDKESLMRRADKYLELQHTQKSYHDIEGNEYKLKIVNIKSQDLSPMYELIPQHNGRTTTHMSVESADKEMQSINNRLLEQQQKQQVERDYENILSNAFPNVNKMQLGKIKKALEKTSTYNSDDISGTMTRKEFVEKAINVGYQPRYDDKVYARNPSEREAHEIAKEYTLYRESDGKVWNIIKAEYDYAMYLLNNRMGEDVNAPTDDKTITQADIDYLQSIIHKTIDLETVDMDKIIEIGEKNETDPLFEQALDVISAYEDEMTKDI